MGSIYTFRGIVGIHDLHDLRQDIEQALKNHGLSDEVCANLVIVVDEWITNVVNYGYHGDKGELELCVDATDVQASICIRDQGPEFDITTATTAEKIKDFNAPGSKPGGLGLELIRRLVDNLAYSRSADGWNKSCFSKNIQ